MVQKSELILHQPVLRYMQMMCCVTHKMVEVKKDIARVMTVLNQKNA